LNAAAGHIAATLGLRGGIASFTSGGLTSDAALRHAVDLVEHGRCERVLVVAAEELTRAFVEFVVQSEVVPLATNEVSPLDPRGPGTALAEAVVCLVVEADDVAAARGVRPYGRYLASGLGTADDLPTLDAWQSAVVEATSRARVTPSDADIVYAAATGLGARDRAEAAVVQTSLTEARLRPVKHLVGDSLGASGAVGTAAALLGFATGRGMPSPGRVALVNSVSMSGQCSVTAWAPVQGGREL
jgi:3-oxoacyl-(acyl-carrier-protein) synthase